MLFRNLMWMAVVSALLLNTPAVEAQFYNRGCSTCGPVAAAPAASCTPVQPVYSACYQTVPVTTYKREKQTVQVPEYKTEYENRDVTIYKPVTTQRTVEVPTVSYRTVTENRVINRDMGRWMTSYTPVQKCAPRQVDPRPGMIGWLNRTGYSFRNSFTPNYRTARQYVPKMVTCNVPVSRQVAVRGTKRVVVNDTKMVAHKTTERVAVRKLVMRSVEQTVLRPQTAYRTVPIGTSLAYGRTGNMMAYGGFGYPGNTSTAWIIDDETSTRTARRPEPDPISGTRSAEAFPEDPAPARTGERTFDRNTSENENKFQRSSFQSLPPAEAPALKRAPTFPSESDIKPSYPTFDSTQRTSSRVAPAMYSNTSPPAAGGWKTSRQHTGDNVSANTLTLPNISLTENK
ncbi:MAG: hypothetical protein P8J37_07610 [Fuerstiella sp.]|nr:hypothetical protein [Fuerstiella sp.]